MVLLRYLKGVPPPHELWEHPTSNIQRPIFNDCTNGSHWVSDVGCWVLDVLLRGSKREHRHSGNSLPVSRFETDTPLRRPETACRGNFLHSSCFLLPSVGRSTCDLP